MTDIAALLDRLDSSDPEKFTAFDRLRVHAGTDGYDFFDTEHAQEVLDWCDEAATYLRTSPSQVAPANPAQVTDAIPAETLRQLDILFARTTQGAWRTYQNGVHPVEVGGMGSGDDYAICTHGPKSFANADWIATMHDEWPRVRAFLSGKEV